MSNVLRQKLKDGNFQGFPFVDHLSHLRVALHLFVNNFISFVGFFNRITVH